MLASYVSYILVVYHAGFQRHHIGVFILTYVLDLLHIFYSISMLLIPYHDASGEIIRDRKLIRKR